jgi:hypothetical protein
MTTKPTSNTPESIAERRSLTGLMILILLTNVWLFTQVGAYVR